jgi:hypothetical protein
MERDNQLKEILLNSAEKTSANFTDIVMQKVNGLSAAPFYFRPLVSPKVRRLFLLTFGALITTILGLCLIITLTDSPFVSWIENMEFTDLSYKTILMFITIFWIVFTINSFIERKFFSRKRMLFSRKLLNGS